MKDEITIGLNGKTIASFGIELKGRSVDAESIGSFIVSVGSDDEGRDTMTINVGCMLSNLVEEKKVAPIEPMVVQSSVMKPLAPTIDAEAPPIYNEIPIKTGKKMGRPKKEDIVKAVEKIEKAGEFVSLDDAGKELGIKEPIVVEEVKVSAAIPSTNVRIAELAKLIKMWCKASALKIGDVDVALLKANAFDIVENDSDETIGAGIKEAARLMQ